VNTLLALSFYPLSAADSSDEPEPSGEQTSQSKQITPFTGKVSKAKVRLRATPSLDGAVVKELDRGELLIVDGISDEFYSVKPPVSSKVYLMRTFVLDGVVEGSRVNVRLLPSLDATVVAQLNTGDRVQGVPSSLNNKWLEIDPPATVRYYVASDFIEKVGDANFLAQYEKRKAQALQMLTQAEADAQVELKKSYPDMKLGPLLNQLTQIIERYQEFPEYTDRARTLKGRIEREELHKKVAFLESKVKEGSRSIAMNTPQETRAQPMQQPPVRRGVTDKMLSWQSQEKPFIDAFIAQNPGRSTEDFYASERDRAQLFRGIVEPYNRPIRVKPGDYILTNSEGRPVAYLYSTRVNLQDLVGQEVAIWATPRPNLDFAFPAYFVIDTQ
jgi:hypothetical protein